MTAVPAFAVPCGTAAAAAAVVAAAASGKGGSVSARVHNVRQTCARTPVQLGPPGASRLRLRARARPALRRPRTQKQPAAVFLPPDGGVGRGTANGQDAPSAFSSSPFPSSSHGFGGDSDDDDHTDDNSDNAPRYAADDPQTGAMDNNAKYHQPMSPITPPSGSDAGEVEEEEDATDPVDRSDADPVDSRDDVKNDSTAWPPGPGRSASRRWPSPVSASDRSARKFNNTNSNNNINVNTASSTLDRVLDGADFSVETWVDRNRRRSLATLRGRSELNLGADELNESLRPGHLDKLRYVLRPDEAFGTVFSWDVIFNNSRALELSAWQAVAEEAGLAPPDMDDILRAESMAPEAAIHRVFYWTADWGEIKRLLFRKCEIYDAMQKTWHFTLTPGLKPWLATLDRYGIKSVLCAQRPRSRVEAIVKTVGLESVFANSQLVTADDECDSLEQMFLVAAIKLERPPGKCVVFTDKPDGITAAREVSARVVALIGAHPAYEIKSADSTVSSFSDLVVYHVRSLFAQEGAEFMDPETELEVNTI